MLHVLIAVSGALMISLVRLIASPTAHNFYWTAGLLVATIAGTLYLPTRPPDGITLKYAASHPDEFDINLNPIKNKQKK